MPLFKWMVGSATTIALAIGSKWQEQAFGTGGGPQASVGSWAGNNHHKAGPGVVIYIAIKKITG